MIEPITRRRMIASLGAGLLLPGCDRIGRSAGFQKLQSGAQDLTMAAQRLVIDRGALAREFDAADLSPVFRTNGNVLPASAAYRAHAASAFYLSPFDEARVLVLDRRGDFRCGSRWRYASRFRCGKVS